MKARGIILALFVLLLGPHTASLNAQSHGYPIHPVLFTDVNVRDEFWSSRMETNRVVTIPYAFQQCVETGRVRNFDITDSVLSGLLKEGKFCTRYGFDDSDIYKIIEGAAYSLHTHYDRQLDSLVDAMIVKIAKAQEQDGYLYTMRTMNPAASWAAERWVNDRMKGSHELYNLGHLYEAAAAHYYATGKKSLLEISTKSADLLCETFGPDKMHTVPGHEVTEIGLAKLSLVTGKKKYLDLAKFFIDERGRGVPRGETYNQDHLPVVEQPEAVGHAVRAGYLYAGMADIAALTGDENYIRAIDRFWDDVVWHKLYLTGGIGAVGNIEGFGPAYELPNLSAYCETCASIANVYWNHRMFLMHGDAKYFDVVERVLYNGFLSGVGMEGNRFFYPNPLESIKGTERSPWFACACCPSNIVRFVPSIPGYIYAHRGDSLYVNLFIGGEARIPMARGLVKVTQLNHYPWQGHCAFRIDPEKEGTFTVLVRIPGWAGNRPVPSDLYRYADSTKERPWIAVNGKLFNYEVEKGYAKIKRRWSKGDQIHLQLTMPVRQVVAHPRVEDDRGKVAFERGPLVYCLEGVDNKEGKVLPLVLDGRETLSSEFRKDLLGGVQVIRGSARPVQRLLDGGLQLGDGQQFTAIPYYAWAHRGRHEMAVWMPETRDAAKPLPAPTAAFRSKVTASVARDIDAITDQLEPKNSNDHTIPYFHWWPKKGTLEWVQCDFPKGEKVSQVKVYWYDDTGTGECRVPASWRVLYKVGEVWQPVANLSPWSVAKDQMNVVTFTPVETSALRLEVQLQGGFSAGLYEFVIP